MSAPRASSSSAGAAVAASHSGARWLTSNETVTPSARARAMTRALSNPVRAPEAARLVWRTADRIWRALGDRSTDENFYSKRAILSGVLASTYARWFSDDAPDHAETWAFLDARIENVMQFEKFKAQLKPLSKGVQSAVGLAARFRYGR